MIFAVHEQESKFINEKSKSDSKKRNIFENRAYRDEHKTIHPMVRTKFSDCRRGNFFKIKKNTNREDRSKEDSKKRVGRYHNGSIEHILYHGVIWRGG